MNSSIRIFYFFFKRVQISPPGKYFWVDENADNVVDQNGNYVVVT